IGSNDLAQLMLGIDRDQPAFSALFSQGHPALMAAIAQIIRTAAQSGMPTTLCGALPEVSPAVIHDLVNWGITGISVSPEALVKTAHAIASAEQDLASRTASPTANPTRTNSH
ncbi:MAG: putative PEP-binding protein, partial [Cyanobacteria bacterium P01_C01_bin.73]